MKIIIVGGGALGGALADMLSKERHDVVVIEKDEKAAESLAERVESLVLHGDGSDAKMLRDADFEDADCIIAMTGDDKANLAVCSAAKGAKARLVARVNEPKNEQAFSRIGVSSTVNITSSVLMLFRNAVEEKRRPASGVAGGHGMILESAIKKGSHLAEKTVEEVASGFVVFAIVRGGKMIIPGHKEKLKEGDIITVCVPHDSAKNVEKLING
jgi:trk system potassium uptake protein TrkA